MEGNIMHIDIMETLMCYLLGWHRVFDFFPMRQSLQVWLVTFVSQQYAPATHLRAQWAKQGSSVIVITLINCQFDPKVGCVFVVAFDGKVKSCIVCLLVFRTLHSAWARTCDAGCARTVAATPMLRVCLCVDAIRSRSQHILEPTNTTTTTAATATARIPGPRRRPGGRGERNY